MKDYTPKTIDDIIFESPAQKAKITDITSGLVKFPSPYGKTSFLLHGKPGTGKTTLARMLPRVIEALQPNGNPDSVKPFEVICRAGNNGVDLLKQIESRTCYLFWASDSGLHYIILHEADKLTNSALGDLKALAELGRIVFILTTNHLPEFESPMQSRCVCVSFNPKDPAIWLPHLKRILADENVTGISDHYLTSIVTIKDFDARTIMPEIEKIVTIHKQQASQNTQAPAPIPSPIIIPLPVRSSQTP